MKEKLSEAVWALVGRRGFWNAALAVMLVGVTGGVIYGQIDVTNPTQFTVGAEVVAEVQADGDIQLDGSLIAGSGGVQVTDAAGLVRLPAIDDTGAIDDDLIAHDGADWTVGTITDIEVDLTTDVTGELPDANVADDLTIDGGQIDATPIGTVTPAAVNGTTADFANSLDVGGLTTLTGALVANSGVNVTSTSPTLSLRETDGPADEQIWTHRLIGGQYGFVTFNDTLSVTNPIFTVDRTGAVVDAFNVATLLDVSGIIRAGSGNVSITDATGNLVATALGGTIDDARLSSTVANLGTAETITANWVNTANPWADNEVADPLTVSGGSVNNSPIGASTPSTGAFTTLSATGNTTLGDGAADTHTITGIVNPTADLQIGNTSGGTDNGNVLVDFSDTNPAIVFRTATTPIFTLTSDVVGGFGLSKLEVADGKTVGIGPASASALSVIATNATRQHVRVTGTAAFAIQPASYTIATGSIAVNNTYAIVDTEASAATDDLDAAVLTSVTDGTRLVVAPADDARTVVIRHNIGANGFWNISGASITLDDEEDMMEYIWNARISRWRQISAAP